MREVPRQVAFALGLASLVVFAWPSCSSSCDDVSRPRATLVVLDQATLDPVCDAEADDPSAKIFSLRGPCHSVLPVQNEHVTVSAPGYQPREIDTVPLEEREGCADVTGCNVVYLAKLP